MAFESFNHVPKILFFQGKGKTMCRRTYRSIFSVIFLFCLGLGSHPASGAIIYVDDDNTAGPWDGTALNPYQYIQHGINAAVSGIDAIEVAPGIYKEAIDFHGKAVRLYSSGGSGVTTINGTGHCHVVQCVSGEDPNTILEGFTITGGNANGASAPDNCGGGMLNSGSSPTVKNCTFRFNTAFYGGGISNSNSSPTVIGCQFNMNCTNDGTPGTGDGEDGGQGGNGAGMYNKYSSPTLFRCTFSENETGAGGDGAYSDWDNGGDGGNGGNGAGLVNTAGSSPVVTDCTFTKNTTGNGGNGGRNGDRYDPIFGSHSIGGGGDAAPGCSIQAVPRRP